MTLTAAIRVLLVDDHPLVRVGLRQLLGAERGIEIVGEAEDAAGALRVAASEDPDVAVVDLQLRTGGGPELVRALVTQAPHLAVLVLSMHDEKVFAERCRRAGALGYLMKERAGDEVVAAVRAVAAGTPWFAPGVGEAAPLAKLSDRELEIFRLIGDGLPTRAIAARLGLSDRTVEAHKANVKKKLGVSHAAELVRLAIAWRDGQG